MGERIGRAKVRKKPQSLVGSDMDGLISEGGEKKHEEKNPPSDARAIDHQQTDAHPTPKQWLPWNNFPLSFLAERDAAWLGTSLWSAETWLCYQHCFPHQPEAEHCISCCKENKLFPC